MNVRELAREFKLPREEILKNFVVYVSLSKYLAAQHMKGGSFKSQG